MLVRSINSGILRTLRVRLHDLPSSRVDYLKCAFSGNNRIELWVKKFYTRSLNKYQNQAATKPIGLDLDWTALHCIWTGLLGNLAADMDPVSTSDRLMGCQLLFEVYTAILQSLVAKYAARYPV